MKKIVGALLLIGGFSSVKASTMYTLSEVKEVYPVVEVMSKNVSKSYKAEIKDMLNESLEALHIKYKGYSPRALAIIVAEQKVETTTVMNVKLVIGEQVYRMGSKEKTFATTYEDKDQFIVRKGDDVEDKLEDILSVLLDKFSDQYKEENKKVDKIKITEENFAQQMHYETNYETAMTKAKREKKPVMMVLVANFCPWCRKFENQVLVKQEVNTLVQKGYIPLIINKEKGNFPKKFDMSFTPIVHFINPKTQTSIKRVVGYNNKDEFLYLLKKGVK